MNTTSVAGEVAKALLTNGAMTVEQLNDHLVDHEIAIEWIDFGHAKLDYLHENGFVFVTEDAKLALTAQGTKYYKRTFKM
jgi:hypothetical protein